VCNLETSRMGAPYIYDISHLRVKNDIGSEADNLCLSSGTARVQGEIRTKYVPKASV